MNSCPCGSGAAYSDCCEPVILGTKTAETAEQLMRARYTAYAMEQMDFLFESTHPDHREGYDHEGAKRWARNSEWLELEIIGTSKGGRDDREGEVEFVARYREKDVRREYHECGHFKQENGRWYFTEGSMVKPKPISSSKVGRNEPCPCGSGLKYKKCCGK
jgi:SEC-C motif-containing protein